MCQRSLVIPLLVFLLWHLEGTASTGGSASRGGSPRPGGRHTVHRTPSMPAVNKCCPPDQALLSGKGCISSNSSQSAYLTHLQSIMSVRVGFPVPRGQPCKMMVLRRNVEHVATWWISREGLLAVEARQGELAIHNYCIDDLLDATTNVASPSAVTCVQELNGEVELPLSIFRSKTVGKCCARDQHFSREGNKCQAGAEGVPNWEVPVPGADNETQLGYTGFPKCNSGKYTTYYFNKKTENHVRPAPHLSLIAVKMDGHCVEKETHVSVKEYCFDSEWDGSAEARPLAVMCAPKRLKNHRADGSNPMLVFILSIACIAVILTMAFLVALQAKGIVHHVPQSGPLAPRAHLTYVGTLLLSFVVLAVAVGQKASEKSSACTATAGFAIFFVLSGFHWMTALCLESLLIIMRLGTSGWRRFSVHCLWAFGLPAVITIIAMSLDAGRAGLPCGTITPRVGRFSCFFSDPDAQMLYLYLPILATVAANLILLWTARHVRVTRLRRLELGAKHHKRHGGSGGAGNGKNSSTLEDGMNPSELHRRPLSSTNSSSKGSNSSIARFGLGTRETQKLWWEAVILALWSGVTLILEVIAFAVANYVYPKEADEYVYQWYIPAPMNALRGIGVFLILVVLPKDSRHYLMELISNAWERCGGKPLSGLNASTSTRRSSTSTSTTATTATTSPLTPGDNERISLSSSDTQLSSHTASMSELHELPRQGENGHAPASATTASTSLTVKPSASSKGVAGKPSSEIKGVLKSNGKYDTNNIHKQPHVSRSSDNINGSYPRKSSDGLPAKPPRKSVDLTSRASLSVDNLSRPSEKNDGRSPPILSDAPQTPPKTPSPSVHQKSQHETSDDITPSAEIIPPQSDSSPDTPPDSAPPTPPTSPPPTIDTIPPNEPIPVPTKDDVSSTAGPSSDEVNEQGSLVDSSQHQVEQNSPPEHHVDAVGSQEASDSGSNNKNDHADHSKGSPAVHEISDGSSSVAEQSEQQQALVSEEAPVPSSIPSSSLTSTDLN